MIKLGSKGLKVPLDATCNLSGKPYPNLFTKFKIKVMVCLCFSN